MILHSKYENKTVEYPTKSQLAYWARLTDDNHHTHVRVLIAKHFQDEWRRQFFENLERKVKETHQKTMDERHIECDVTTGMLEEIHSLYGEEVYTKVNNCL